MKHNFLHDTQLTKSTSLNIWLIVVQILLLSGCQSLNHHFDCNDYATNTLNNSRYTTYDQCMECRHTGRTMDACEQVMSCEQIDPKSHTIPLSCYDKN
jgi:uncharacterized protein YceK